MDSIKIPIGKLCDAQGLAASCVDMFGAIGGASMARGQIIAHGTESGSHRGYLAFGNRDSSNGGDRTTPSFPIPLFHRLVDEEHTTFQRLHFTIVRGRVPFLVDMHLLLIQVVMCPP